MPRPILALVPVMLLLACQKPTPDTAGAAPVAEVDSASGYSPGTADSTPTMAIDSTAPITDTTLADTTAPKDPTAGGSPPAPADTVPAN